MLERLLSIFELRQYQSPPEGKVILPGVEIEVSRYPIHRIYRTQLKRPLFYIIEEKFQTDYKYRGKDVNLDLIQFSFPRPTDEDHPETASTIYLRRPHTRAQLNEPVVYSKTTLKIR